MDRPRANQETSYDRRRVLSDDGRLHGWMNPKVYEAAAQFSDQERKADRGAFFRSIHCTLNHILWAIVSGCHASITRPIPSAAWV